MCRQLLEDYLRLQDLRQYFFICGGRFLLDGQSFHSGNAEGGVCAEHPGHFGSQHRSVSKCSLPAVFYRQIQELVMKCDESIFQEGLAHKDVNSLPLSGFRRLATRQKRRSTTRCRSHCS